MDAIILVPDRAPSSVLTPRLMRRTVDPIASLHPLHNDLTCGAVLVAGI